jgi:hypothetical protein
MFMVGMVDSPRLWSFQDSLLWQELAKFVIFPTSGTVLLTPFQQRYNECRWGTRAGRWSDCIRRNSCASHKERAATTPLVVFTGFGIRFAGTGETHRLQPHRKLSTSPSVMD